VSLGTGPLVKSAGQALGGISSHEGLVFQITVGRKVIQTEARLSNWEKNVPFETKAVGSFPDNETGF
jgi:hypothetical protein